MGVTQWSILEQMDEDISNLEKTRPLDEFTQKELFAAYEDRLSLERNLKVTSDDDIILNLADLEQRLSKADGDHAIALTLHKQAIQEIMWRESESLPISCPTCANTQVFHSPCGNPPPCECYSAEPEYYCVYCQTSFLSSEEEAASLILDEDIFEDGGQGLLMDIKPYVQTPVSKKCDHVHEEIVLSGGTKVYASASSNIQKLASIPDFGLYADRSWVLICQWPNEFINWPDMQIPVNHELSLSQITQAYTKAASGLKVDTGCIGAHGRTGTILAIMNMIDTGFEVNAEDSISYIRENYCKKAVETNNQVWFVKYAGFKLGNLEDPGPMTKASMTEPCILSNHVAMKLRGHLSCLSEPDCLTFDKDMERWNNGEVSWVEELAFQKLGNFPLEYGGFAIDGESPHVCSTKEHYAMFMLNKEECCWNGQQCKYWMQDFTEWTTKGVISGVDVSEFDITGLLKLYGESNG